MQSRNKPAMTEAERRHVTRVKLMPCGVCGDGGGDLDPSEAHELQQGQWFTSIPLCADCHRGSHNGIHGNARIWQVGKHTELTVLNDTIRRMTT
jgi:hypothetical protein